MLLIYTHVHTHTHTYTFIATSLSLSLSLSLPLSFFNFLQLTEAIYSSHLDKLHVPLFPSNETKHPPTKHKMLPHSTMGPKQEFTGKIAVSMPCDQCDHAHVEFHQWWVWHLKHLIAEDATQLCSFFFL